MEQIRVQRGIEIGVNDNGDSIFLDVENVNFFDRFKGVLSKLEEVSNEFDRLSESSEVDAIEFQRTKIPDVMAEIDSFIGEGTCEKVFGKDFIPTVYALADFFSQLAPIASKYATERDAKILKEYNPNRRGKKK